MLTTMHGERTSADRAKAALRVLRRSISGRFSSDPFKGIDRKVDKCQDGCPGVLSTHRAMANYGANRRSSGAIADCPAKTSTFNCDGFDHVVHRTGEAIRRDPFGHGTRIEKGAIDLLGLGAEYSMETNGAVGHGMVPSWVTMVAPGMND